MNAHRAMTSRFRSLRDNNNKTCQQRQDKAFAEPDWRRTSARL